MAILLFANSLHSPTFRGNAIALPIVKAILLQYIITTILFFQEVLPMEEDYYSFIQLEIESFSFSALLRVKTDQRATSPPPNRFSPNTSDTNFEKAILLKMPQ